MTKQLRIHVVWFALLVFLLFTGVSDAKRQKKQSKTTAHIDQQTHKEAANGDIAAEPEGEDTGKEGQGGFANATSLIRNDDPCRACSKLHRGILHRVMDPGNSPQCSASSSCIGVQRTFPKVAWYMEYYIATHSTYIVERYAPISENLFGGWKLIIRRKWRPLKLMLWPLPFCWLPAPICALWWRSLTWIPKFCALKTWTAGMNGGRHWREP